MLKIYFRNIRSNVLEEIEKPRRGAWVRVVDPSSDELSQIATDYKLDKDLLADGIDLYEVPRIEQDEGNLYIYVRFCRPEGENTSTHPLLIVVQPDVLLTISRIEAEPVNNLIEGNKVITTQKLKVMMQVLEQLNIG